MSPARCDKQLHNKRTTLGSELAANQPGYGLPCLSSNLHIDYPA